MKVTTFFLLTGALAGGLAGCSSPQTATTPTAEQTPQPPHLLPEQVNRIAKARATDQKVNLSDFNMAAPQIERREGKLIWSVLFTPKTDGVVGTNFYIEIEDATRQATYHGER